MGNTVEEEGDDGKSVHEETVSTEKTEWLRMMRVQRKKEIK